MLFPLVCKGFNADFDGDQMAVHLPLSLKAQAEAYVFSYMFSHRNLLSLGSHFRTDSRYALPTQDMLIGLYVLTINERESSRYLCK
jgi:DNA-directed RNA polymerase subunit beta'